MEKRKSRQSNDNEEEKRVEGKKFMISSIGGGIMRERKGERKNW